LNFYIIQKIFFKLFSFFFGESYALAFIYKVQLGKNCRLNNNNYGSEPYLISFGDYVSAINVDFITHDGAVWIWRREQPKIEYFKSINIGSNVFIGTKALILPGSNIGSNVIIGAGSVVKGKIQSGYVYAGVPAKRLSTIDDYFKKNKENFTRTKLMPYEKKREFLLNFFKKRYYPIKNMNSKKNKS